MTDWAIALWIIDPTIEYNPTGPNYEDYIFDYPYPEWIPPTQAECIAAYQEWLNGDKKEEIRQIIIDLSELEKSKYITNVPGKVFAYYQKGNEVKLYEAGYTDEDSVPTMFYTAQELGVPLVAIYNQWKTKTVDWGKIGGKIEAKYDKYIFQLEAATFTSEDDVDEFIDNISFEVTV